MDNYSMFDSFDNLDPASDIPYESGSLDVVKMEFLEAETMSWQELFSGFDELHAITYSSGIGFVYKLLEMFDTAEIIFGCDEVISYSLQEVMAYQCKLIERMRESASKMKLDLISRIEDESLHFYVARTMSLTKRYIFSPLKTAENVSLWVLPICHLLPSVESNVRISAILTVSVPMIGTLIAILP